MESWILAQEGILGIKQAKQNEGGKYSKHTALLYIKNKPGSKGGWEGKSQGTAGARTMASDCI
jgi:hypothetical protein